MPARYWRKEWKKAGSILRRFGQTLRRSQASLTSSVAEWMDSLADTPASLFPAPESGEQVQIHDTFSRTYETLSKQYGLFGASSKTSADTCPLDSPMFIGAYEAWATELRLDCLRRRKSALRTRESGCSSWGTPRVTTNGGSGNLREDAKSRLEDQAAMWLTPDVPNGGRALRGGSLKGMLPDGRKAQVGLENQVKHWPTPRAEDAESCGNHPDKVDSLTGATRLRPTPQAHDVTTRGNTEADHPITIRTI